MKKIQITLIAIMQIREKELNFQQDLIKMILANTYTEFHNFELK